MSGDYVTQSSTTFQKTKHKTGFNNIAFYWSMEFRKSCTMSRVATDSHVCSLHTQGVPMLNCLYY